MPLYTYVSVSEEDKVSIFLTDPTTGGLQKQGDVVVPGVPAPLAVDPGRRFLFVGRRGSCEISSFQIDPDSGGLALIGTAPLESDPCYLATDRNGKFLLSTYYAAGKVAVHSIGDDGSIGDTPVEWLDTSSGAHSIQTDPSNRYAFVPHIAGAVGPNLIYQFRFDERTGRLTPNSPFKLVPGEELGPRHYCFHPTKDVLYFSNEQGCSITAYGFDATTGTLSAFQTISTLTEGYQGENTCAQIQITGSGRYLYAPNRGHNSIAGFSVDATTAQLTPIGHAPAEAVPRAFGLDPGGNFLYAAGLDTGVMTSYRIDGDTGELEPLETYHVGKAPMWVLMVRTGE
mgnify:CR=1 FL=1|jgi:6-phosphogluconolactonase